MERSADIPVLVLIISGDPYNGPHMWVSGGHYERPRGSKATVR
ncbi:MAG: hypothetical protein AB8B64_24535 [Granulosicoccus sp.]